MDKNITLERRFSLNTTHLTHPIAESTCVNMNGSRSSAHFQWGGSPISAKNRSNSSNCLSQSPGESSHNGNASRSSIMRSPDRSRANMSKIDPRIYADVQSKGLASRIVKYHENGTRLQRSMSMNTLYNKPGQFPVVHLKKTELPYRATKQKLSMTRIAPPEKTMFHGNTLASLLRSNSVLGLQKSNEELSHENRPILHPPPTASDLAPTRSVLDVLKEISRKRINSDELDASDATKKYCNRNGTDVFNTAAAISLHQQQLQQQQQQQQQMRHAATALSYKRQRERVINSGSNLPQSHSRAQLTTTPASSRTLQTAPQPQSPQYSPEQLAKKRQCSYNNDITSSLSSSVFHANKRKLYAQQQRHNSSDATYSPNSSPPAEYETQKAKMQRQHPELRFEQFQKTLSCGTTPITPIPATPVNQVGGLLVTRPGPATITAATVAADDVPLVTAVPAQRSVSEPIYVGKSVTNVTVSTTTSELSKPKLTLFNKQYDERAEQARLALASEPVSPQDEDCAGIQFVKPKKSSSVTGVKNPLIERTQKSKLAMMLCGLRGELYQGVDDEVDAPQNKSQQPAATTTSQSPAATFSVTPNSSAVSSSNHATTTIANSEQPQVVATTAATMTTTTVATSNIAAAVTPTTAVAALPTLGGFKLTPPTALSTSATPTTAVKASSPLVGLKLLPQTAASANTTTQAPTFAFGTPTTAASTALVTPISTTSNVAAVTTTTTATMPSKTNAPYPVLSGFSFSSTASTKTAAPTSSTAISGSNIAPTTAATVGGFAFGATAAPVVTTAATAPPAVFGSLTAGSSNKAPPSFAFGNTPATTRPTAPPSTTTSTTAAFSNTAATLSFGSVTSAAPAAVKSFGFGADVPKSATATLKPPAFSASATTNLFGSANQSTVDAFAAQTTTTTTSMKPFAFGGAAVTAATNATAVSAAVTTTAATMSAPTGGFNFGSSQQKPAAAAAPFSFAAGAAPAAATQSTANVAPTANSSFGFGSASTAAPNSNNAFGFGATATANSTSQPAAAAANSFVFGSGAATTNPPTIFGTTTTTTNASSGGGAFSFGATTTAPTTQALQPASFASGGATTAGNSPFSFGATKFDKPAAGGFSFGGSTAQPATVAPNATATGASLFSGGPAANNTTTGIVKPSFSFGGSAAPAQSGNNHVDAGKSLFGGTSSNSNNNNTFGALAAASANGQNKTFTFGANNNTAAPPNANNLFGGAANSMKAPHNGFAFGGAAPTNNMQQNKPTAVAAPTAAFSFGGAPVNNNNSNHASQPFAFGGGGGAAANHSSGSANKSFSFGGNTSVTTAKTNANNNIFSAGAPTATSNMAPAGAAFNFSAAAPAANAPNAGSNIFAPPPGDRPIRRATRRLQKS